MNFSWRAVSRLFNTSSLTLMRRSQFATRFRASVVKPAVKLFRLWKKSGMNAAGALHALPHLFRGKG